MTADKTQNGFTLIELSIVLLIIGLIISGVLVGQELIRAAEIRATISQIDRYRAATNAFRDKYAGLPGDLLYTQAQALNFYYMDPQACGGGGSLTQKGCGDNNGLIDVPGTILNGAGEELAFWRQLSDAKMIDGNFGRYLALSGYVNDPLTNGVVSDISDYLPAAKMGQGLSIVVFAGASPVGGWQDSGTNFFGILQISSIDNDDPIGYIPSGGTNPPTGTTGATSGGIYPLDAFIIDSKIDDGMPNTGKVLAMGGVGSGSWDTKPSVPCTNGQNGQSQTPYFVASNKNWCALKLQF